MTAILKCRYLTIDNLDYLEACINTNNSIIYKLIKLPCKKDEIKDININTISNKDIHYKNYTSEYTNKNKLELVGNANIQKEINTTKEILKLAQRLDNIIKENIWVGIQHNI